jgi:hypothetical protein
LGILSIAVFGLLLYDLFWAAREPFNPSISEFPIRVLLGVVAGGIGLFISNLILWQVPGNPVGRLLLLWAVGGIGWQFSYNFGVDVLDQLSFILFAFYFAAVASTAVVLMLFYFPDGRFYPGIFKSFVPIFVIVKIAGAALAVTSLDPSQYNLAANPLQISELGRFREIIVGTVGINGGLISVITLILGFISLARRYRHAELIERQQIKWMAWAGAIMAMAVAIFVGVHLLVLGGFATVVPFVDYPFFILASTLPTLAVGVAVLRYGLWEINFLISRTVIYFSLTAILAAVFAASAALVNQVAGGLFEAGSGAPAALVSTILIVVIFQPVRQRVESWIEERYFPENRFLSRDFIEFSGEYRSLLTRAELLGIINDRICDLLGAHWSCIFVRNEAGKFSASSATGIHLEELADLRLPHRMLTKWGAAKAVRGPKTAKYEILAPLYVPRVRQDEVIGILALGPRERGRGYSRNDLRELARFGADAGKVLFSYLMRSRYARK